MAIRRVGNSIQVVIEQLNADELTDLLKHSSEAIADEFQLLQVSRSVNRVEKFKGHPNDGPELVEPI